MDNNATKMWGSQASKMGKGFVDTSKVMSRMFDKGVDKYVDECGAGVDDLIDDLDDDSMTMDTKTKKGKQRDKHKRRGSSVAGDMDVVGVKKDKRRSTPPTSRPASLKKQNSKKLEVFLAKTTDSDDVERERPRPSLAGKGKRRPPSKTEILPSKDDDSSDDLISEESNNANPFDKFQDLVKTASYLTERAFNPFAKTRTEEADDVSKDSRLTRSTARASEVASIVDDNSFMLWDVFPNHSLLWEDQQKQQAQKQRDRNVFHPPASPQASAQYQQKRPSSERAYRTTGQVDEQFKNTLFSESTDRYEKAKSANDINQNQGPLYPMMMSFDTNGLMSCGGMNQVVDYPVNFQVAPEAEARWQKSKNPNRNIPQDLESQQGPGQDSRLGSFIKIPADMAADAGSIGTGLLNVQKQFMAAGGQKNENPAIVPGEGTSGPGWMFFLYIYLAGIIYGSLLMISIILFFVSFNYTEPFNTERERDLFQIACLAVAAMFGWVLSSMWISYKDRLYGWAFISSLPSIAVIGLVVVVLSTTNLEYNMVYTPAPTPSPIMQYYYNRGGNSRDDYYREGGQYYNNGQYNNGQYNNQANGANGEYNQYNGGNNYYNYNDP